MSKSKNNKIEIKSKYPSEESFRRAFIRMAVYLKDIWDEYNHNEKYPLPAHSRIFDVMVVDDSILLGKSIELKKAIDSGLQPKRKKEHIVPCAFLRNEAAKMFHDKRSISDVADMLQKCLKIAYILPEEAKRLDSCYLWTEMPPNWNWETDSILARLQEAKIELVNLK